MTRAIAKIFLPIGLIALVFATPASAGAREALAGLTGADDAVVHDNGNVSICKGGTFPGCSGGRAFHCPSGGGPCTETQPNQFKRPKPGVHGLTSRKTPGGTIIVRPPALR